MGDGANAAANPTPDDLSKLVPGSSGGGGASGNNDGCYRWHLNRRRGGKWHQNIGGNNGSDGSCSGSPGTCGGSGYCRDQCCHGQMRRRAHRGTPFGNGGFGGRGGGIVLVNAAEIIGSGSIRANGEPGASGGA